MAARQRIVNEDDVAFGRATDRDIVGSQWERQHRVATGDEQESITVMSRAVGGKRSGIRTLAAHQYVCTLARTTRTCHR